MKKSGTPSGAAPGSAKENVGFDGVGTPDGVVGAAGLAGVVVGFVAVVGVVVGLGFAFLPPGPDPEE
jgi:hypothetical protein